MTEHEALIESILDEPDDDLRRLVYADWLEERGTFVDGLRAKLIRLQVPYERATRGSDEHSRLYEQISAIENRYSWLLIPSLPPGFTQPMFDRGLIKISVSLLVSRFIERGEDYHLGLPPYCRLLLRLTSRLPAKGKILPLLDSPAWPLVSELTSRSGRWSATEVQRLAADPRVRCLEELFLHDVSGIGDAEIDVLANSPHFSRLRTLILYGEPIGDAGLAALAHATGMPRLRLLRVMRGKWSGTGQEALRQHRPTVELDWPQK